MNTMHKYLMVLLLMTYNSATYATINMTSNNWMGHSPTIWMEDIPRYFMSFLYLTMLFLFMLKTMAFFSNKKKDKKGMYWKFIMKIMFSLFAVFFFSVTMEYCMDYLSNGSLM